METAHFKEAQRELRGLTASIEKRALVAMAARLPAWVGPDHLTALGLMAAIGAGACYALSRLDPLWLNGVNACLFLNWFGDSLDGTLARYRQKLRPRYGFYVDHIVDAFGALALVLGLALSGYMSERIALGLLIAYYLLSLNIYLATYTRGVFKISYGAIGGTELRIVLALVNVAALWSKEIEILGARYRVFDALGILGIVGIAWVTVQSVAGHVRALYEMERV